MSLQANILKAATRAIIKRNGLNQQQLVQHMRRVANHPPPITLMPRGVKHHQIDHPQFQGDLVTVHDPQVTMLYFHGGAYIAGTTRTYFNLTSRLARLLHGEVFLPEYPFAPEHPYPAAVNRVLEAYEYLLAQGRDPQNIVIAGDSAGGGLTLATLLHIRDKGLPRPRCAVMFSPASNANPDPQVQDAQCPGDAMLSADMIRTIIDIYLPDEQKRSEPYASPGLGDYSGLPPLQIFASTEEVLYSDAKLAREAAGRAGVPVDWIERDGLLHVWPIFAPFLPEANRSLKRVVRFIKSRQID